mgnify:CR=1 FL=1
MSRLLTASNTPRPDEVFEMLTQLHEGLSIEESLRANARLVLLLVNHIGDEAVIREAVALSRASDPDT